MNAGAATTNYGTNTKLAICGYADQGLTNRMRPILRFDLSSIAPGTTVSNATLYLYAYDQTQWRGDTGWYGIYPLTRSFTESQVTWTIAATGTNWTTAGGDFNSTADATSSKKASASVWYAFNVTSRAQGWINTPASNYGWTINCTDESLHNQDYFTPSDNSDTTHRPKLVINDSARQDTTAPAAVSNLATSSPTSSSITLSWTAPGDDGNTGTATTYDIRYRTGPSTTQLGVGHAGHRRTGPAGGRHQPEHGRRRPVCPAPPTTSRSRRPMRCPTGPPLQQPDRHDHGPAGYDRTGGSEQPVLQQHHRHQRPAELDGSGRRRQHRHGHHL